MNATRPTPAGAATRPGRDTPHVTRLDLFRLHARFYTRYAMGLGPIFAERLAELPPDQEIAGIPRDVERKLRAIVLARGFLRRNDVFVEQARDLHDQLLEAVAAANEPAQDTPLPVVEVGDLTPDDFFDTYVRGARPVVLRGLDAPALHWTVRNLVERFGDTPTTFNQPDQSFLEAPFRTILERDDLYVNNVARLCLEHPELRDEMRLDRLEPYMRSTDPVLQVFIGAKKGTGSPFHAVNHVNIFHMIEGRKKWWFIDPNHFLFIYPYLLSHNTYHLAATPIPSQIADGDFPLFRYCPRQVVTLEPGDLLLNPAWCFHAVENLDDHTIGAATRWFPPGLPEANKLLACLQSEPLFIAYLLKMAAGLVLEGKRPSLDELFERWSHSQQAKPSQDGDGRGVWLRD